MVRDQAVTDRRWREASVGFMRMEKISYRSRGELEVPAFVFQPLETTPRRHPALVWVHENIRGHLYEHYIPFVREAVTRGFVVLPPSIAAASATAGISTRRSIMGAPKSTTL